MLCKNHRTNVYGTAGGESTPVGGALDDIKVRMELHSNVEGAFDEGAMLEKSIVSSESKPSMEKYYLFLNRRLFNETS